MTPDFLNGQNFGQWLKITVYVFSKNEIPDPLSQISETPPLQYRFQYPPLPLQYQYRQQGDSVTVTGLGLGVQGVDQGFGP